MFEIENEFSIWNRKEEEKKTENEWKKSWPCEGFTSILSELDSEEQIIELINRL